MKLYVYYFADKNAEERIEPFLYAYTNDKELADKFEDTRDMNKFILKTKDNIKKKHMLEIAHTHSRHQLVKTYFDTKDMDDPTKIIKVPLVCTWEEEETVFIKSDQISYIFSKYMFNPVALNLKLQKSLNTLGYFQMYNFLYNNFLVSEELTDDLYRGIFHASNEDDELPLLQFKIDYLAFFYYLYGGTMSKK